jgi:putative transposase
LNSDPAGSAEAAQASTPSTDHSDVGLPGVTARKTRLSATSDAAMESFFALLQKNVLDRQRWKTRDELRLAIITWIEATYHRRRRQRALGRLTPIEYELLTTLKQAA